VGDDALAGFVDRVGVDFGDDEGHVGVHAPAAGVVDDGDAGGGEAGCLRFGEGGAGAEDGDVEPGGVGGGGVFDGDVAAVEFEGGAGGAGGGEEADFGCRKTPLLKELSYDGADLSGGADDADADGGPGAGGGGVHGGGHRPVPA